MLSLKKFTISSLAFLFIFGQTFLPVALAASPSPLPSIAVSPTTLASSSPTASSSSHLLPRGPQGPIGPQGSVGPQGPIGPQSPVPSASFAAPIIPVVSPSPTSSTNNPTTSPSGLPSNGPIAATSSGTGNGASNTSTGSGSTNTSTNNQNTTVGVDQTNSAATANTANVNAATGSNTADRNTGWGTSDSGNVNGQLTIVNISNAQAANGSTAASQVLTGPQNGPIMLGTARHLTIATNDGTGADSINVAQVNKNNLVQINVTNAAAVQNDITIAADTGHNSATDNTGDGRARSGNVNLAINLINLLNLVNPNTPIDLDVLSVFGDVLSDLLFPSQVAKNDSTGATSTNNAIVTANNKTTITTDNNATIANAVNYDLTTGNNSANGNTLGGDTTSGTVNGQASITNIANAPTSTLWLVNVYGTCDCDLSALDPSKYFLNIVSPTANVANTNTGADSTNNAKANEATDITVNQTNTATVNNMVNVKANTGSNTANNNTGRGLANSGNIDVMTNIVNVLNSTVATGQRFALGIINIFGNWKGKAGVQSKPLVDQMTGSSAPSSGASFHSQNQPTPTSSTKSLTQLATVSFSTPSPLASSSPLSASVVSSPSSSPSNEQTLSIKGHQVLGQTDKAHSTVSVTIGSSPHPTVEADSVERVMPSHGIRGLLASIAHAANKKGVIGSESLPPYSLLALPVGLWLLAEFVFAAVLKKKKVS